MIINNCKLYNKPDTVFYKAATKLEISWNLVVPKSIKQIEAFGIGPNLESNGTFKDGVPEFLIDELQTWEFFGIDKVFKPELTILERINE